MKKEKKIITHKYLDKNTIPGTLLLMLFAFLVSQAVFGSILGLIISLVTPLDYTTAIYLGAAIGSFIVLAIHKRWFYPEFAGNILTTENLGKWILIAIAILAVIIIPDFIGSLIGRTKLGSPTLASVLLALMAGTSEEVAFRAVPGSYMMRQYKDEKKLPLVILLTSVVFSLVHASNIFSGAAISSTLVQLVYAFSVGVLLCVLYLRSGSIVPSMIIHFLNDVFAFMNQAIVNESGVMTGTHTTKEIIINLIISAAELFVAYLMLRGNGRKAIMEIWAKKWSN